jgi:gliding motility-associated-like protein
MKKLLLLCFTMLLATSLFAQSFNGTYNFSSVSNTTGKTDPTTVPTATGVTFGSFTANGAVSTNPNASGRFSFTSQPTGATNGSDVFTGGIDLTKYYEVTITPASGYTLNITGIKFSVQRSATGIRQYSVRSSKDGYAANLPATISPANADLQVVSGNVFQVIDIATAAEVGSTITLTGFTSIATATTFRFYGYNAEAAGGTFSIDDVSVSGSAVSATDNTPPVNAATYPKTSNITSTAFSLTHNIDEAGKTYYVVTASGSPAPTPAQVKAGLNGSGTAAIKSGSLTNAANTDVSASVTGLTAATSYAVYVVAEDVATTPNVQSTVSLLNVTTLPLVDVTPPVFAANSPAVTGIGTTSFNLSSNINEAGKTYYVLVAATAQAPGPAQVKAGLDGSNTAALKSGLLNNIANTDAAAGITGLTASTAYKLYVVAEDNATLPNLQTAAVSFNITTFAPPTIIISQYYEGSGVNKWIELTNLSNSPVNTSTPQLKLGLWNISGDAGNINITGAPSQVYNLTVTIPARGTVLIGNTNNSPEEIPYLTAASAAESSNTVINFNGNDGVALLDANNNIIDAFGQDVNAKDVSYVRHLDVASASSTFIADDWTRLTVDIVKDAVDDDDANKLGVHFPPNLPNCAAPTIVPGNAQFTNTTTNSISFTFNKSDDATEYLIIRSLNSTLSVNPTDGTTYAVGTALGGGVVVARQATPAFNNTGLTSATKYYYFIYALNNTSCLGGPKYLTSALIASETTKTLLPCVKPASQPQNFVVTNANHNFVQASYAAATNADDYLVVMATKPTLTALPADQTVYNVGDNLGGGIVVKSGAGTSFTRYGLTQNTQYYFFIFSVNSNCTGGPLYLTTNPLVGQHKTSILDVNKLNFYYGNLHSHSSYSDGNQDDKTKIPIDDYEFAKKSMNLDFLGISEHNHSQAGMMKANWQKGIDQARNATTPTFLALHGMEWGVISGGGHVIVYGIDSLVGWENDNYDIFVPKNTYTGNTGLFRIINRHGLNAVATLAHPNTTDYNNLVANYDISADSAIVGTALESGPATSKNITYSDPASSMSYLSYYNRMLAKGYHLGATIDHDNHNLTFGRHTKARLVVLSPALTENDILDAVKKMRFYASEDSAAKVLFTINKQPVGSVFTVAGAPQIEVTSKTTKDVTSIKLMYGEPGTGVNPTELLTSATGQLTYSHTTLANLKTGYYYADIVESDGSRIITSPIWYTRDDAVVKKDQQITFTATKTVTYGDPDFDAGATSDNTSINIVYTSSNTNVAKISNNDIQIVGAGTATITATQPGDAFYNEASKQLILTVAPKPINVKADAKTKVEGTSDPVFTYTATPALLGTDVFTGALTRDAGETPGDFAIKVGTLAINPNYAINYTAASLHIYAKPVAALSGNISIPVNTTAPVITFTATAGTAPFTFTYNINGGASQTLTSATNTATVTAPSNTVGTFVYTVTSITDAYSTQPQNISTTVKINPIPVASIAGTTALCLNAAAPTVTFTGGNGTGPYIFTYNINGGASQTVSTTGTNTTAMVTAPSNVAGIFNYNLLNVSDVNAGQAQSGTATITVRTLATASISGSTAVPNLAPAPNITFTGANGTAPYTFTYNINGGASRTVTSTGNTATVSAPTSAVGTFVYNLVSVADVNCGQPQTGSATVIIRPLPIATIAGTTSVCNFGSTPNITFTGSVGIAPYTFTYTVNGGSNRTVTTNSNTATVSVPTNATGTFTYTLVSVADAYASQTQTGTATVTVNALPVVSISSNKGLSISKGDAIILTATGGTQYSWSGSDVVSGQNTPALTIRPKQSGSYRVNVTNASGCVSDQTIAITVIDDYKLEASTVVTPNGDGYNDKFIVKNIDYYPNNTLKIFDKAGRILYTKHTYTNDWDGTINGSPLSEGTYYYIIDLGNGIGTFKGYINIIRD